MRTTLDIDDDILSIVRDLARSQRIPMGKALSRLARSALTPPEPPQLRNGVPLITPRPGSAPVTLDLVNQLRDEA